MSVWVTSPMMMPAAWARWASATLLTRTFSPRSQRTILPATLDRSSVPRPHCAAVAPSEPVGFLLTSAAYTRGALVPSEVRLAPRTFWPLPSTTVPLAVCQVLAAAVVTQGLTFETVAASGPSLPPAVATKTPEAAALRNATAIGSMMSLSPPAKPTEKLITSTPSETARSMAATMSELKPLASDGSSAVAQSALYVAILAAGAMPVIRP